MTDLPLVESTNSGDWSAAINAIAELSAQSCEPADIDRDDDNTVAKVFVVPNGYQAVTVDLEDIREMHRDEPKRKQGNYVVGDVASFLAFYDKHASAEAEIWVRPTSVVSTLDAHGATEPNFEQHRVTMPLVQSPEWKAWTGISGRLLDQVAFAEFLEAHTTNINNPDAATVLEIAQSLEAALKVDWKSSFRTSDGQRGFRYEETSTTKAGAKGELEIPTRFLLGLRPWTGVDAVAVSARFRYRITSDGLLLGVVLDDLETVLEDALADLRIQLNAGVDRGLVLVGA